MLRKDFVERTKVEKENKAIQGYSSRRRHDVDEVPKIHNKGFPSVIDLAPLKPEGEHPLTAENDHK